MPRQKTERRAVRLWAQDDRLSLLAYLNWTVENSVDLGSTASEYLQSVTGKHFKPRQIIDRLRLEWRYRGACDKFKELYTLGTAGLNLDEETISLIEQKEVRIGGRLDRPRRLTSATKPCPQHARWTQPKPSTRSERPGLSPDPLRNTEANKHFHGSPGKSLHDQETEDEAEREAEGQAGREKAKSNPDPMRVNPSRELPLQNEGQTRDHVTELSTNQLETMRDKASIITLRGQLSELRGELEEMGKISHAPDADPSSLLKTISYLRDQIEAKDELLRKITYFEEGRLGSSRSQIQGYHNMLFRGIHEACSFSCGSNGDISLLFEGAYASSVQQWAKKVSGWRLESLVGYGDRCTIPREKLFAALVAGAVFEQVFESVFPDLLAVESPLLRAYRKHILLRFGRKALQQIDLISLHELKSDALFMTDLVPEKVMSLSMFLVQALQSFIPPISHATSHQPHSIREVARVFGDAFVHPAFDFKHGLDVTERRYKFHFFKPGESFDPNTMDLDHQSLSVPGSSVDRTGTIQSPVLLCLFPAFYSVPAQCNDGGNCDADSVLELSASYNKYLTEARLEELGSLVLVAKARVLIA